MPGTTAAAAAAAAALAYGMRPHTLSEANRGYAAGEQVYAPYSLVNRVPEVVSCISRFGKAVTIQSQWWDDFETRLSAMGAVLHERHWLAGSSRVS